MQHDLASFAQKVIFPNCFSFFARHSETGHMFAHQGHCKNVEPSWPQCAFDLPEHLVGIVFVLKYILGHQNIHAFTCKSSEYSVANIKSPQRSRMILGANVGLSHSLRYNLTCQSSRRTFMKKPCTVPLRQQILASTNDRVRSRGIGPHASDMYDSRSQACEACSACHPQVASKP